MEEKNDECSRILTPVPVAAFAWLGELPRVAALRRMDTVNGAPEMVHPVYRCVMLVGCSMAHTNWR